MSEPRYVSCASGNDAFSSIRVDQVRSLIRLECPKDAELTPDNALQLADALRDFAFRINHRAMVHPDGSFEA